MPYNSDPYNNESLWPSGYQNNTAVYPTVKLGTFRSRRVVIADVYIVNGGHQRHCSEGIRHFLHR